MKTWDEVKKGSKVSKTKLAKIEHLATVEAFQLTLKELRKQAGLTQEQLADAMHIGQAALSALESRKDHKVSTLREILAAMGGELEVVAVLDGQRIPLAGV
jgi:DNA-binding XRE family transcriptional regulator